MRDLNSYRPRRRDLLALGIGAFVVAAIPLATRTRRRAHRLTLPVMGTIADLVVVDDDRARARAALDAAARELRHVETLMSRFDATSDVGRLNATARGTAVRVTPDTAYVARSALAWAARSNGRFDPCLGNLSTKWDEGTPDSGSLGTSELHRALDLDTHRGADFLLLASNEAALDFGGIAKGHAVDRAMAAIQEHGVRDALVNAGGDLAASGRSADGDAWRVGIRDPADPAALIGSLDLQNGAIATSGDYATATVRGEQRIHHLLDPRTAAPHKTASGTHSLTITAHNCMTADAAATALFGLPEGPETTRLLRGTSARIANQA